jgi:hypothetical protein
VQKLLSILLISASLFCATVEGLAQEKPQATNSTSPAVSFAPMPIQVVRGPLFAQLYGSCTGEIAPTVAIIAGGVAVDGIKPLDAADNLDKTLEAIRKYVEEKHGKLILLERVRTLKNPGPNNSSDVVAPFEVVQRLHVELPVSAPIDAILQRLLELGLDRFGETVLAANGRREEAVLYRIDNLDSALHEMERRCIEDAWKKWCATDPAKGVCKSDQPPADLQLGNFSARSDEEVLLPGTAAGYWQVAFSRGQDPRPPRDLLGNIALHLTGTVFLNYSYPREETP